MKEEVDKEDKIKNDIKDNEEGHKFKSVDVENFKNKDEVTKDTETRAEKKSEETLENKLQELDEEHKVTNKSEKVYLKDKSTSEDSTR